MFGKMKREMAVESDVMSFCDKSTEVHKISHFFLKSGLKMPMSYMGGFNNQNDETPGALCVSGQVRR